MVILCFNGHSVRVKIVYPPHKPLIIYASVYSFQTRNKFRESNNTCSCRALQNVITLGRACMYTLPKSTELRCMVAGISYINVLLIVQKIFCFNVVVPMCLIDSVRFRCNTLLSSQTSDTNPAERCMRYCLTSIYS